MCNNILFDDIFQGQKMSEEEKKKATFQPPPLPPIRPGVPEERWPSPTPLPVVPTEDTGRLLKQILERLDAIEKRLDRIEKILTQRPPL